MDLMANHLCCLPNELKAAIFKYLPIGDLINLCLCSKQTKRFVRDFFVTSEAGFNLLIPCHQLSSNGSLELEVIPVYPTGHPDTRIKMTRVKRLCFFRQIGRLLKWALLWDDFEVKQRVTSRIVESLGVKALVSQMKERPSALSLVNINYDFRVVGSLFAGLVTGLRSERDYQVVNERLSELFEPMKKMKKLVSLIRDKKWSEADKKYLRLFYRKVILIHVQSPEAKSKWLSVFLRSYTDLEERALILLFICPSTDQTYSIATGSPTYLAEKRTESLREIASDLMLLRHERYIEWNDADIATLIDSLLKVDFLNLMDTSVILTEVGFGIMRKALDMSSRWPEAQPEERRQGVKSLLQSALSEFRDKEREARRLSRGLRTIKT